MSNFKRNENGLIEGVEYKYLDDGRINWRAMIRPEFLVVQKDYEREIVAKYGKDLADLNLSEIDDRYLLILLGGIKDLLRLRGYSKVSQRIEHVSDKKAVATCTIEFLPNFETGGQSITFSDVASASVYSVSGVFQLHLEAIASNRAFVRCVRNALGINIAGKDEFDVNANEKYKKVLKNVDESFVEDTVSEITGKKPANLLATRCSELNISFEKLKERAILIKDALKSDPNTWTGFENIQNIDAYSLITKINEAQEKKKK